MKPLGIIYSIYSKREGGITSPGVEAHEDVGIKTQKFLTKHETLQLRNKEALTCFKKNPAAPAAAHGQPGQPASSWQSQVSAAPGP